MADQGAQPVAELAYLLRSSLIDSDLEKLDQQLRGRGTVTFHLTIDAVEAAAAGWWFDRLDREARRAARLFQLPLESRTAFRPVRTRDGGLGINRLEMGSVDAVLSAYGAVESFLSSHPLVGAAAVGALVRGGRGAWRVFKRLRSREPDNSDTPTEMEVDDADGQPVADVRVDVSSRATDQLLLPGRDFEMIDKGRLVVRHRDGQMDTILRQRE